MATPSTNPSERAKREQEALRQMWEAIAWISAFLAVAVFFLLGHWIGGEAGTIVLLALIGITAFACWRLRPGLGESVSSSVSMRLGLFSLVFLALLLVIPFVFFFVGPIVAWVTDWYVKKFP